MYDLIYAVVFLKTTWPPQSLNSFSSDSDNSLTEPIDKIESKMENSHGDHKGVGLYSFEPWRDEGVASVGDNTVQDAQNSVQVREEDYLSCFVFIMTKRVSK